jgi:hypothetical protein
MIKMQFQSTTFQRLAELHSQVEKRANHPAVPITSDTEKAQHDPQPPVAFVPTDNN